MPTVFEELTKTMMFTGAIPFPNPLTPDTPISAPEPSPQVSQDHAVRLQNPVWSWTHDPDKPSTVTNVQSKVLGMNMNYAHSMLVCSEITLSEVNLTTAQGANFLLPLDKSFVMMKFKLDKGHIPQSSSGMWRLEAELDQSIMIVFGYQIASGNVVPFTRDQAAALGQAAMPDEGKEAQPTVAIGQEKNVLLSPLRILVAFSVICCKERNDFEPGGVLGANRVYPHAMVMTSQKLNDLRAVVTIVRPANTTPSHGDPEMKTAIGPILITDTNIPVANTLGPALPEWDNLFDYFELNPFTNSVTQLEMVNGDPNSPRARERTLQGVIMKEKSFPTMANFYDPATLKKMPRQGDFDNIHLAPRMKVPPLGNFAFPAIRAPLLIDDIAMAPFCVHDCLHTHTRWGVASVNWLNRVFFGSFPDSNKGFDTNFNPNSVEGAPMVPHNQTVKITLSPPASFDYEGIVNPPVDSGRWHVFFHHGMAYANELWDVSTVDTVRTTMELVALKNSEEFFNKTQPLNTPSLNAGDFWSIFYWRLRFGGFQDFPVERLKIINAASCRSL
jgi:hypothetical protein